MNEATIAIPNASWWMPHSQVLLKEDLLAEDQAWIANQTTRIVNPGTSFARVESYLGDASILLVKRMVVHGTVAVKRSGDRVKTVTLPQEAGRLLRQDLDYIASKINEYNQPMTEEQQQDFLPAANGQSETNLQVVNPFPTSSSDADSTQN